MLPGETILTGAPPNCDVCNEPYEFTIMQSGAGFYIGTQCCTGPNTRETRYWRTREEADAAMLCWENGVTYGARMPTYDWGMQ